MWWLHPMLERGYEAPLDEDSVWDLPTSDQAGPLQKRFDVSYWAEMAMALKKRKTEDHQLSSPM